MILAVCVSFNEILEKKKFPWPRPRACPKCGGPRLWFHGFVLAYFDGFKMGVWLRRLRCPDCRAVHRMRPAGYFRRFQASVTSIRFSIRHRLETGRWPPDSSRQRQGQWLRAMERKVLAVLGLMWLLCGLVDAFDQLIEKGEIPASRSFKVKLLPGETLPTEEFRCTECPFEIGGPPSFEKEVPPWAKTRIDRLRPSDLESSTTWWEMWSSHLENKNNSSEKRPAENGLSRSPPSRGSPAAQSCAG